MTRKQEQANERGFYRLSIRMPIDVQAVIEEMSKQEERSLNAQIIWCLRECAKAWKREQARKKKDERGQQS